MSPSQSLAVQDCLKSQCAKLPRLHFWALARVKSLKCAISSCPSCDTPFMNQASPLDKGDFRGLEIGNRLQEEKK